MPSDLPRPASAGIHLGDRVVYSKRFLQSTGQHTGDAPLARGEVKELTKLGTILLAHVRWDRAGLPDKVNVHNLSRVVDGVVMGRD